MMRRRFLLTMACVVATAALVLSSVFAWAADARLDLAYDNLVKAKALIAAAEDPGARRPFGGHARKAVDAIDRAIQEVIRAKQAADAN